MQNKTYDDSANKGRRGASSVLHQANLPPSCAASHMDASSCPTLCLWPGKFAEDCPSTWDSAPTWKS